MKLSAFSIIRNGIRFDYPFVESIRSALPLVDEFILNIGKGDDTTLQIAQDLINKEDGKKLKIVETDWELDNPEKKRGGRILSEQTNLALDRCSSDWCLYLQADEVLHEGDYSKIRTALLAAQDDPQIEGLLFHYLHFYGSFDVVQHSRSAYRREVRAVRKSSGARSVGDAQSFRKGDGSKLAVIDSGARIFHYGWVRTPEAMREKTFFMDQLYHGSPSPQDAETGTPHTGENYRYKRFWGLRPYLAQHPEVMRTRIETKGWHWDLKNSPWVWDWRDAKKVLLDLVEKFTGKRLFEYRSYRLLKFASPRAKNAEISPAQKRITP